jgi:hypothetical protein
MTEKKETCKIIQCPCRDAQKHLSHQDMAIESSEPSAKPCFCPSFSGQRNQSIYTYIYIYLSHYITYYLHVKHSISSYPKDRKKTSATTTSNRISHKRGHLLLVATNNRMWVRQCHLHHPQSSQFLEVV